MTPPAPQPVLFVGGLGRSGSTLIEKLLNETPGMVGVGETIHLWERGLRDRERCGCGNAFDDCPHWQAVGERAFGSWDNVDLAEIIRLRWEVDRSRRLPQIFRAHKRRPLSADEQVYLDHLRAVLLASAETTAGQDGSKTVLVESSKHLSTAALLTLDPALDVRVLHVVRDPRGVAYSWTKQVARPEADGALMPTYRPERTAARWVTDNMGFRALSSLGVPTLQTRYEDFLDAPVDCLRQITEFVGLSPAVDLGFIDDDTAPVTAHIEQPMHSIAGNPMRFGGADLTLRLDDAWKSDLDQRSKRIVTAITAPALSRFNYPVR